MRNIHKSGTCKTFLISLLPAFTLSCSLFTLKGPSVVNFSPGEGYIENCTDIEVSLVFSSPMDMTSVEEGFTLTRDGEHLEGIFSWHGNTMMFSPSAPMQKGFDYYMLLETSAEDSDGKNLTAEFSNRFTTRYEHIRPEIVSSRPQNGSAVQNPRQAIEICFSEPMDYGSIYTAFRTFPEIRGVFDLTEGGRVLKFIPDRDLRYGQEYRVELGAEAADLENNSLGEEYGFSFYFETDAPAPVTVTAHNEEKSCFLSPVFEGDPVQHITEGWERRWHILLEFSEEVYCSDLEGNITLFPSAGFSTEPYGGVYTRTLIIIPEEPFPYDEICMLQIESGFRGRSGAEFDTDTAFYFNTNGPGSLPPEIVRVTFLKDPSSGQIEECIPYGPLDLGGYIPHSGGAETGFFDIYFRTAESASISLTECIEHFSIEASGDCASIVPVLMKTEALPGPDPLPPPEPDEQILRIYSEIRDNPSCGTVTLRFGPDFRDTMGNELETEWVCIVNEATP